MSIKHRLCGVGTGTTEQLTVHTSDSIVCVSMCARRRSHLNDASIGITSGFSFCRKKWSTQLCRDSKCGRMKRERVCESRDDIQKLKLRINHWTSSFLQLGAKILRRCQNRCRFTNSGSVRTRGKVLNESCSVVLVPTPRNLALDTH